jgi:lipopolysaccharide transport system ATP-binding protein
MSDDVLVRVENVSKRFCRSLKRSLWYGLQDLGSEIVGDRVKNSGFTTWDSNNIQLRKQEFWALKDINLELRRGESLGLIGANGAGKTTLLKMLNGLIKPDTGKIVNRGRISALIALGSGFNPVLTGRENVYVNTSILGISKRSTDAIFDEIVDFAGIASSIDAPVSSYSSGMQVRLGFAIASALKPDILFIDEVLAVGDYKFKGKCYNRIKSLRDSCAIILVSHSETDLAKVCNLGMVLKKGEIVGVKDAIQPIDEALVTYHTISDEESGADDNSYCSYPVQQFKITNLLCHQQEGYECFISFTLLILSSESKSRCRIRVVFTGPDGELKAEWDSAIHNLAYDLVNGHNTIAISIDRIRLSSGCYVMTIILTDADNLCYMINTGAVHNVMISGFPIGGAAYKL